METVTKRFDARLAYRSF